MADPVRVPLLDLKAQHATIRDEVLAAMTRVVDAQTFILGEDVRLLEREVAEYSHAAHAVSCASGSDALYLALLGLGVGQGDEVVTTPYTFFATAGAIHHLGAVPVFVDVENTTFNIDPQLAAEAIARRPKVKAVIPVHLFGACADMDPIVDAARHRGVFVIEDAAQSIGAEYQGRRCGTLGDVGCLSFFPSKNLGGYGDGGMLLTDDEALAKRLGALRVHGARVKYVHDEVGINSRLDTLQAAVLRVKLRHLDGWTEARQRNADLYRSLLAEGDLPVRLPGIANHTTRHVYNQFVILAPHRDELREYLAERGIGTEVYYPIPLHLQRCFSYLGHRQGDFPVSERLAEMALALPIYSELKPDDIAYVCESICSFYRL